MQKSSDPRWKDPGAFPQGVARMAEALEVPLAHCFFSSSVMSQGIFFFSFFFQCRVNHFTELSSFHPDLPNRVASDMFFFFALRSIITLVNFQKECLACHPLSNSLMIKTEALAVNMPAIDRAVGLSSKPLVSLR